jgi:hypothetical protein
MIVPRLGLQARKIYITWHRRDEKIKKYETLIAGIWRSSFRAEMPEVLRGIRDHATLVAASEKFQPIFQTIIQSQKSSAPKTVAKLKSAYKQAGKAIATDTAVSSGLSFPGFPVATQSFLDSYIPKIVEDINTSTRKMILTQISNGIEAGDTLKHIATRIRSVYSNFSDARAYRISQNETGMIASLSEHDMFAALPIDKNRLFKTWHNAQDDRVRDLHEIESETVTFNEKFSNGLRFPKDPEGDPENVINCRCYVSYAAK